MQRTLILISIFVLSVSSAQAFDGEKKGFILGGGYGVGRMSFKQQGYDHSMASSATEIKIGYAPTNRWQIFWGTSVYAAMQKNEDVQAGTMRISIGASYYFSDKPKSTYVTAGMGRAETYGGSECCWENGLGGFVGYGWEFAKHWSVEGAMSWADPGKGDYEDAFESNVVNFQVSINILAF